MKVLHINQQSSLGGTADIAVSLVRGIKKQGHAAELQYFFNTGTKVPEAQSLFPIMDRYDPTTRIGSELERWVDRNSFYFGGLSNIFFGSAIKKIKAFQPDIVHLHNLHGGWVDLKSIAQLSREVQIVMTLHDEWLLTGHCGCTLNCRQWEDQCSHCPDLKVYPSLKFQKTAKLRREKLEFLKTLAANKAVLVTPSKWLKSRVDDSGMWEAKKQIVIIPNGIDTSVFQNIDFAKSESRNKLNLPLNKKILMFAADGGTKNPFKEYGLIEEAIQQLDQKNSDLCIVVAGDKLDQVQREVINKVEVIKVGYLNKEHLLQYYCAADALIYPTRSETFGLVVVEAMASGLPVMATAVSAVPELIEHGQTGILFKPQDLRSVLAAIKGFLNEEHDYSAMGIEAREEVFKKYDQQVMIERYINLYRELKANESISCVTV